jgi:hypothetical protein
MVQLSHATIDIDAPGDGRVQALEEQLRRERSVR